MPAPATPVGTSSESPSSGFELPTPTCPSPPDAVRVPDLTVSIANGPTIVATRRSSTFTTCTTTAASDAAPKDPTDGLAAHAGDRMTLNLPAGWGFLHREGYDRPAAGQGGNIWPAVDSPERPMHIDVPVPARPGDSIAECGLWIVSLDGRVVGQLDILVRVTLG